MSSRKSSSPNTSGKREPISDRWPADAWHGPILVIRLSSLGDVVLATTAVNLLKSRRPDLEIDFLTRRPYDQMLRGIDGITTVLTTEEIDSSHNSDQDGTTDACRYELVLDLQGGRKGSRACHRFAYGARRLIYDRAALRRRLLVATCNHIQPPRQLVTRFGRLIAGHDVPPDQLTPSVAVSAQLKTSLSALLSAGEQPPRGWVMISPGASKRLKALPQPLVERLTNRLQTTGRGVIELRPPASIAAATVAKMASPVSAIGTLGGQGLSRTYRGPLISVAPLLSLMQGVIASDSGVLHLATAVGTPAVGVLGPTVPELGFSPLGNSGVVGVDLWCRPCHIHGPDRCWRFDERCWAGHDANVIIDELENLENR